MAAQGRVWLNCRRCDGVGTMARTGRAEGDMAVFTVYSRVRRRA